MASGLVVALRHRYYATDTKGFSSTIVKYSWITHAMILRMLQKKVGSDMLNRSYIGCAKASALPPFSPDK